MPGNHLASLNFDPTKAPSPTNVPDMTKLPGLGGIPGHHSTNPNLTP